jgi:hypothetical protein
MGADGRERRFAQRAEAAPVPGKARLRPFDVGNGVTAESESVMRAGFAGGLGRSRTNMAGYRRDQPSEGNHCHETNRSSSNILHRAVLISCPFPYRLAAGRKVRKQTYCSLKTGRLLMMTVALGFPALPNAVVGGGFRTDCRRRRNLAVRRSCRLGSIGINIPAAPFDAAVQSGVPHGVRSSRRHSCRVAAVRRQS